MQITAQIKNQDAPQEMGGGCYVDYSVEILVGEKKITVPGWMVCGWLAPGSSQDLDGCGLELWGSNQPGGWSWCHGDGLNTGRPRVSQSNDDSEDPITICSGTGLDESIDYDEIPEWGEAVRAMLAASEADDDDDEAWRILEEDALAIRQQVIDAIQSAIDGAVEDLDCPEPSSIELYDDLDPVTGMEEIDIRLGNWNGGGYILAWMDGDEYRHTYWPDRRDIRRALESVQESIINAIEAELPYDSSE